MLGRTAEGVVLTARQRLISQLLRLPVGAIDRLKPGDLLARVTSDTTLLRSVSTYGLVHSVNAVFMLVGCVVLMGVIDLALLAVTLAVLALNGLAVLVVVPRIRRATERSQAAVGGMSSALERSLGSFRTVKAMGAEDREIRSGRSAARRAWRRGVEVAGWTALMEASAGLAVQVSFLAVLGVGGARVAGGDLPVSSLIAFLLYLFLLSEPISALVNGVSQLQAGLAAVTRLGEVQDLPVERGAAQPGRPVVVVGRPRLGRVHRGVVPLPRRRRPLGPPGPVLRAAPRRHDRDRRPLGHRQDHRVRPAGAVLRAPERLHLGRRARPRQLVAARPARRHRPRGPGGRRPGRQLGENLRLAAPGATDDELDAVLTLTRLDGLLDRLPDGLDTPVGHRAVTLSGGERQRLAIARALLRHPRLLLLDEATSQLDAVNEQALRDLVEAVALTTTVLVIAHRLSTVTSADRILVFDAGRVRAVGTHEQLLAADDLYRQLATTQLLAAGP